MFKILTEVKTSCGGTIQDGACILTKIIDNFGSSTTFEVDLCYYFNELAATTPEKYDDITLVEDFDTMPIITKKITITLTDQEIQSNYFVYSRGKILIALEGVFGAGNVQDLLTV